MSRVLFRDILVRVRRGGVWWWGYVDSGLESSRDLGSADVSVLRIALLWYVRCLRSRGAALKTGAMSNWSVVI